MNFKIRFKKIVKSRYHSCEHTTHYLNVKSFFSLSF